MFLSTMMVAGSIAQPGQGRGYGPGQGRGLAQGQGQGIHAFQCQNIPDLTEEQQAELKTLRDKHFKEMKDFRNQMGEIRAKQTTVMSQNPIDEKAAAKLIDQKTELMNKQMKAQVSHRAAVKKVLTEEQVLAFEQRQGPKHFGAMQGKGRQGQGRQGRVCNYGPQERPCRAIN